VNSRSFPAHTITRSKAREFRKAWAKDRILRAWYGVMVSLPEVKNCAMVKAVSSRIAAERS
jgi:hypothetical protein